jgi:RimJ/RimL family protein N-acetyltransferase
MRLETERLYIEEITLDDVTETYVSWLNDNAVNRYLETRFSEQNLQAVTQFVASMIASDTELLMAIKKKDGSHIGNIKLGSINLVHKTGEVSYFIGDKSSWGKGFATEVVAALTGYAFNSLQLRYLKAGVYSENTVSAKVLEKVGYRKQGVLKQALILDGKENDHCLYTLHRDWFY